MPVGLSGRERLVAFCADRAWLIVLLALLQGAVCTLFVMRHFALSADTAELLSPRLEWRVREAQFNALFPPSGARIVVVVDGQTPELAEQAAASLAGRLVAQPALFRAVRRPDAGPFWARNGLLYLPLPEVRSDMSLLIRAEPFLAPMAADPSLRGLMTALSTALQGVGTGQASLRDLRDPLRTLADALAGLRSGRPTFFSWRALIGEGAAGTRELRRIVLVDPKLDFAQLQPGEAATTAIRAAAQALQLDAAHGVSVRMTGPVPLQDQEFGTLAERATLIACLALGAIVVMLWMAVRSARLIACILVTMLLGLVTAIAVGLAIFQRFNVISVAMIPLFVGLGIDFGIQFSVRFRAEHTAGGGVRDGLLATAQALGRPLALAATAIAVGFLAFTPTDYLGVSQLGVIAGLGMFIALALNLTLLPALIRLARPPGAADAATGQWLTQIDRFVLGRRRLVIGLGVVAALASAALLPWLHFDFNPLHLRSARTESVATLLDLAGDADRTINTLEAIRPSLAAADRLAAVVRTVPVVASARTLSSFIPGEQSAKLAVIADAAELLDLAVNPLATLPTPDDAAITASLATTRDALDAAARADPADAAEARRLAQELAALARSAPAAREAASQALIPGVVTLLEELRQSLQAQPVSLATLPPDLVRDWLAPDGRARISILPRGDSNDNAVLTQFVDTTLRTVPDATGAAVATRAAGRAIVGAFTEAGLLSFIAITALLLVTLRRIRDVAITMAPIVLTGLLTMASCVLIGQPLNFANIIALPLLFGIGVAFHIYFVMSWRSGGSHLLTSSLARAVFFSALSTATGFGSLWASSHPGTASMGELLMISLVWTLLSALLFQPALMGPPPAVATQ